MMSRSLKNRNVNIIENHHWKIIIVSSQWEMRFASLCGWQFSKRAGISPLSFKMIHLKSSESSWGFLNINWLIGGLEHFWNIFHNILGMSSSQLTFIFFRGGETTTNQLAFSWTSGQLLVKFARPSEVEMQGLLDAGLLLVWSWIWIWITMKKSGFDYGKVGIR